MKNLKLLFSFLFLCNLNSYAQNGVVYREIEQAKSSGGRFDAVSALMSVSRNASQKMVRSAIHM